MGQVPFGNGRPGTQHLGKYIMFDHPYICLDTEQPLEDEDLLCWLRAVVESGPPGISVAVQKAPGEPPVSFYMRNNDGKNHYVASLARNLSGEEATAIADAYSRYVPEGDFVVHWSQEPIEDKSHERMEENALNEIVLEAAKINHNRWNQRKQEKGWRYGISYDALNRTSPLCRDWDSLPETYQQAEISRMLCLLEVLDKMKLKISKK